MASKDATSAAATTVRKRPSATGLAPDAKKLKTGPLPVKHAREASLAATQAKRHKPSPAHPHATSRTSSGSKPARNMAMARRMSRKGKVGKKKMVIKPFKVKPKPPAEFEENTFKKLSAAVSAVHEKRKAEHSQEELYRSVESLCLHKKDKELYDRLHKQCNTHIQGMIARLQEQSLELQVFLEFMENTWNDHCNQMLTVRSVFLFLDRTHVIQAANSAHPRSLWDMGLRLFCQHFTGCGDVQQRTVEGLLHQITRERNGEAVQRSLIKTLVRMFSALGIYSSFEEPFLNATESFYRSEGQRLMQEMNTADYLLHVSQRLEEENERVTAYLDPSSRKTVIARVQQTLVKAHVKAIIANGFDSLANENRRADLARMYFLLSKTSALEELCQAFKEYIEKTGSGLVTVPERDRRMVPDLLDFKSRLDGILAESFNNNKEFERALKEAFENFMNVRQNRPAELIARFVDAKLRANQKGLTSEELDKLLDRVMELFRFVQGKDVFQAFYKKHLARRLLLGKSASRDAEMSMIDKIKKECGPSFTQKLEGMFQDIDLSKELNEEFVKHRKNTELSTDSSRGPELSVRVLTMGQWPEYVAKDMKVPVEIAKLQDKFKNLYLSKYNGRKLTWQHSLGTCVLKCHFPRGRKEFVVSSYQAVVLMLFNEGEVLTFQQIIDQTGLSELEARRTLESLSHVPVEVRILQQNPRNKNILLTDRFRVNKKFKHKLFRIKLASIQMRETKAEQKQTTERVFANRQYSLDATIVRVMKARKKLSHQQLMAEVLQQLKFPATPQDIKRRIQNLMERDYIERDEEDSKVYNYVA